MYEIPVEYEMSLTRTDDTVWQGTWPIAVTAMLRDLLSDGAVVKAYLIDAGRTYGTEYRVTDVDASGLIFTEWYTLDANDLVAVAV